MKKTKFYSITLSILAIALLLVSSNVRYDTPNVTSDNDARHNTPMVMSDNDVRHNTPMV